MQTTITVQLDEKLILYAKNYAEQHGKSVSQLVAEYFVLLKEQHKEPRQQLPPITQSLLGVLRGANIDEHDYKTYLEEKYL